MNEIATERVILRAQIEHKVIDEVTAARRKFDLMKRFADASNGIAPLIIPALVAVRKEIEMPLDVERYSREAGEMLARLRESSHAALQPFEEMVREFGAESK